MLQCPDGARPAEIWGPGNSWCRRPGLATWLCGQEGKAAILEPLGKEEKSRRWGLTVSRSNSHSASSVVVKDWDFGLNAVETTGEDSGTRVRAGV